MILKNLKLKDFRNYKDLDLEFNPGSNIFFGDNGAGKTNLLDAIYFLAFLRSRRTSKDDELIGWGKPGFYLNGNVERRKDFLQAVEVSVYREGIKKLKINSKIKTRFPSAEEGLKVVAFYPDDFLFITSTPQARRRFLNLEISQIDAPHRLFLRRYQEILSQRNASLRKIRRQGIPGKLFPWDAQLVETGAKIVKRRILLIGEIYPIADRIHRILTGGSEHLKFKYINSCGQGAADTGSVDSGSVSTQELAGRFSQSLASKQEKEIDFGMTLTGPHRDDLIFLINDVDASVFSSHAQQRTVAISLRLALAEHLEKILGEPPVILLDDVLSELDKKRWVILLDFLQSHKMQFFITGTNAEQFRGNLKQAAFWEVGNSTVNKETSKTFIVNL